MSHHINLTRIKGVAHALRELNHEIAFVGGLYERVKEYIKHEFAKLLSFPHIDEWISAHLDAATSRTRTIRIMEGMKMMTV